MEVVDADQRQQALSLQQSFIVQAPAGSGKTALLIARYLSLLSGVQAPEEIVAITFTRKAAQEMRERILSALALQDEKNLALAQTVLERDRLMQWHLLENPHRLRILTIDALCAYLVRQMPVLAKLGLNGDLVENDEIYFSTVYELFASLGQEVAWREPLKQLLSHCDNNYQITAQLLVDMLKKRDQWFKYLTMAHMDMRELRKILESGLQHLAFENLQKLISVIPEQHHALIMELANFAGQNLGDDSPLARPGEFGILPEAHLENFNFYLALAKMFLTKEGLWRKNFTVRDGFPAPSSNKEQKLHFQQMKTAMLEVVASLQPEISMQLALQEILITPPLHYQDQQWEILVAFLQLLPILAAHLKVAFQQNNQMDYIEIALAALTSLGDAENPTDLALNLDYQIQHLLVDEFQDTSIGQFHLLEKLTAGWMQGDGRTLFIVGDPMQSIYRFRKAEVSLFTRVQMFGINDLQLTPLILQSNFRAQREIVDWVNQTMLPIFPGQVDMLAGSVPFSPSVAMRDSDGLQLKASVQVHALAWQDAAAEAAKMIEVIEAALQQDPDASIAILVRTRSHLAPILPILKQAGIAYRATEIESLARKSMIQDLTALTTALIQPMDRLAWLSCLRAPWCGLTLPDLQIVATADDVVYSALQRYQTLPLSADGRQRLAKVAPILLRAMHDRLRLPWAQAMENCWLALGGAEILQAEEDLLDARLYFELLAQLEQGGEIKQLTHLQQALQRLFAAPSTQSEVRVEVMTMHKSKGLEFDVVILPALQRTPKHDAHALMLWMERARAHGQDDLLMAPLKPAHEYDHDPIYKYLRKIDSQKSHYEMARVLYVAATRAKVQLHLLAQVQVEHDTLVVPAKGSFLAMLWPVLSQEFNGLLAQQADIAVDNEKLQLHQDLKRLPISHFPSDDQVMQEMELVEREFSQHGQEFASLMGRNVGVLLHRILYQIADKPLLSAEALYQQSQQRWRQALMQLGTPPHLLTKSIELIVDALQLTLNDTRGQWLLKPHHQAVSPLMLTKKNNFGTENYVLDRSFIDEEGVRWIIDYRVAEFASNKKFLLKDEEKNQFYLELKKYADALPKQMQQPVKLAVYFPMHACWWEMEVEACH